MNLYGFPVRIDSSMPEGQAALIPENVQKGLDLLDEYALLVSKGAISEELYKALLRFVRMIALQAAREKRIAFIKF